MLNSAFFAAVQTVVFAYYLLGSSSLGAIDAQRLVFLAISVCCCAMLLSFWALRCGLLLIVGVLVLGDWVLPYAAGVKHLAYIFAVLPVAWFSYRSALHIFPALVMVTLLVASVVAAFLVSLCALVFWQSGQSDFWFECFAFFTNVRFLNHLQVASVAPLLYAVVIARGHQRWCYLLGVVLLFYVAILSSGRGVWVASFVAVVSYTALVGLRRAWRFLAWLAAGVVIAFALVELLGCLGLHQAGAQGAADRTYLSSSGRVRIWEATAAEILKQPFTGHGAYSYGYGTMMPEDFPAHPHQHFLQVAYEWGLPLAVLLYLAISGALLYGFLQVRRSGDAFSAVLLASLVGLTANAQFSATFTMPVGQMMVLIYSGLLLGRLHLQGTGLHNKVSTWPTLTVNNEALKRGLLFMMLLSLLYWVAVSKDYVAAKYGAEPAMNFFHEKSVLRPRTWENGS